MHTQYFPYILTCKAATLIKIEKVIYLFKHIHSEYNLPTVPCIPKSKIEFLNIIDTHHPNKITPNIRMILIPF